MAPRTIYLGRLIGLYCLLLALALLSHKQATLETINRLIHDAPVLLFAAILAMAAGLAIVVGHNVWTGGALPVLVTLVGWISLAKGLVLLFLRPETSVAYFGALRYGQFFYAYMCVTLVIGIYLTISSFRASA